MQTNCPQEKCGEHFSIQLRPRMVWCVENGNYPRTSRRDSAKELEVSVETIPTNAIYSHSEWCGSLWISVFKLPDGDLFTLVHGEYSF